LSISNYIDNYNSKRDKIIQRNIEYSNNNPYPIDELTKLGDTTVLKYVFDENGEIPSAQRRIKLLAIEDNKDLYDRLSAGDRGLKKLKHNKKLLEIDPAAELRSRFNAVVKSLNQTNSTTNGNIKLEDWLNGEVGEGFNNFSELYDAILYQYNMTGIDADIEFVISAFKELSGIDETINNVSVLNDEDIIGEVSDGEDPLNEGETTERVEDISEVTETSPVIESESTLIDEDIIDEAINDSPTNSDRSLGEIMRSARLDSDITQEDVNMSINLVNEALESINPTTNQISETSNIDNSINDYSSNKSFLDKKEESTSDVINNTSSVSSSSSQSSGAFDDDMAAYTPEEIEFLTGGNIQDSEVNVDESNSIINELTSDVDESSNTINESDSSVDESSSIINELTEDNSQISGDSIEMTESINNTISMPDSENSEIDSVISETEVIREKVGIDKSVAPINTPPTTETKIETSAVDEDVKMTEVKSESNDLGAPNKTETSITNNENTSSENMNAGHTMVDMSQVEARLRKIENLLSSPLEVKIID
jgi:hypothetical protein